MKLSGYLPRTWRRLIPVRKNGFTLVEIMVAVALLGLLLSIAVANFMKARGRSQQAACIANMVRLEQAVQEWAMVNKLSAKARVDYAELRVFLHGSLICPAGVTSFEDSYLVETVAGGGYCQRVPSDHLLPPSPVLHNDNNPEWPNLHRKAKARSADWVQCRFGGKQAIHPVFLRR